VSAGGQLIDLVARGLLNKQIGYELGISEETVKVHRGHAMRKLEIDSVPSLVRLLDQAAWASERPDFN
jgi:FixJ family two-component response regulator